MWQPDVSCTRHLLLCRESVEEDGDQGVLRWRRVHQKAPEV